MYDYEKEDIERKISFSHYGGRSSAFEDIERDLKRKAGELFANGQDKEAELIRCLSVEIGKRALDERKTQKNYEPKFSGGL